MDHVLKAGVGTFKIQGGDVNFSIERISQAVDSKYQIPAEVKQAAKEFIQNVLQSLADKTAEEIFHIPDNLIQYGDFIIEIIKSFCN